MSPLLIVIQCFPATKKRDVPSKRDILQDIAKAFGFGSNATIANGTIANATGVAPVASQPAAPVAQVPAAAVPAAKVPVAQAPVGAVAVDAAPQVVPQSGVVAPAGAIPTGVSLPMPAPVESSAAPKATTARMYGTLKLEC